jgi:AraC-like DNA-binding protein
VTAPGVATLSGRAGGLTWEFVRRPVDVRLAGLVVGLAGYAEHSDRPVRRHEGPGASVPVILSFGPAMRVGGARHTTFAAGMHDRAAQTEFTGEQCGIELRLTPLGAFRLLGVPPGEYANQAIELPLLDRLAGQAAGQAPDWAGRLDAVEAALLDRAAFLDRAARAPAPDPAVAWAWRVLERSGGAVPVGALAEEIGWSRRHFAARFRHQVGLTPKAAARVLRFERASRALRAGGSAAAVAAACGYADQSHLVREFRALAGRTPTGYLAERDAAQVTFVQDG